MVEMPHTPLPSIELFISLKDASSNIVTLGIRLSAMSFEGARLSLCIYREEQRRLPWRKNTPTAVWLTVTA